MKIFDKHDQVLFDSDEVSEPSSVQCTKDCLELAVKMGVSLEGAYLYAVDLLEAKLARAQLQGADLRSARLLGADLQGADLTGAVGLSPAVLRRCRNWHLALYDEDTAAAIRAEFPLKAIQACGYESWEDWHNEQRKIALSSAATLDPQRGRD